MNEMCIRDSFFGLAGTFTSFIILGNYGLGLQTHGRLDILTPYTQTGDQYTAIISMLEYLPLSSFVLILLVLCMITFYSTSFDLSLIHILNAPSNTAAMTRGSTFQPDKMTTRENTT